MNKTKELLITSLFIALTFLFTMFINIKLPIFSNGGLIHIGNVPLFVASVIFGKKIGMYAGAIGMGMFDLVSGWILWFPFTFLISGIIGYIFGKVNERNFSLSKYIIAIIFVLIIKVFGYYIAEIIIIGNFIVPLSSIPGNILQIFIAGFIAFPIIIFIKKYNYFKINNI